MFVIIATGAGDYDEYFVCAGVQGLLHVCFTTSGQPPHQFMWCEVQLPPGQFRLMKGVGVDRSPPLAPPVDEELVNFMCDSSDLTSTWAPTAQMVTSLVGEREAIADALRQGREHDRQQGLSPRTPLVQVTPVTPGPVGQIAVPPVVGGLGVVGGQGPVWAR